MGVKKKPKTPKKPKAKPGEPKVAKVKSRKPKVAALAPKPQISCEQCVRNGADEWCGQQIVSSKTTLEDAFAFNGVCNNGSLRTLGKILKDACGVDIDPDDLSCSMTLAELITLVCGS